MRILIVPALLIGGCASAPSAEAPAAPVIAAERAFAADGARRGWAAAFRSFAAPEAVTLSPDPINAHENLARARATAKPRSTGAPPMPASRGRLISASPPGRS